jgi:uncharacterized protein (DUF305 family)
MKQTPNRMGRLAPSILAVALAAGCASSNPADGGAPAPADPPVAPSALEAAARADSVRAHYTDADVAFMTGMIHHHAQALVMSRMAPGHGASDPMRILTARIINGQRDEIQLMQRWLRERDLPVPHVPELSDDEAGVAPEDHAAHGGHGGHAMPTMPGMLSPEQMAELDAARGEEWDRLFLTYMIQHHKGALTMVEELFSTYGAGQGDEIFKIASDIGADQASEIDRMQRMLQELMFGPQGSD